MLSRAHCHFCDSLAKMHNLNVVMRKYQTNLNEQHFTKELANTLLRVKERHCFTVMKGKEKLAKQYWSYSCLGICQTAWSYTRSRSQMLLDGVCVGLVCVNFASLTTTTKSLQPCPTLWDPIDGSSSGSPIPGILQARTLEWVAISLPHLLKRKSLPQLPCPSSFPGLKRLCPGTS